MPQQIGTIQPVLDAVYTARSIAAAPIVPDGNLGQVRGDRRGELFVENLWNSMHALAEEGSLFVAQTATPGTGITLSSATGTTFSDTQAIFGVNNVDPTRDVIPLWLKLIITAAGTAGTDDHFAGRLDIGAGISGGTASLTGKCVNPLYGSDVAAAIFAGVPTVAAATGKKFNVGRAEGRKAAAPAYIVGDVVTFIFGAIEQVQAQAITPTSAIGLVLPMPATIIPPGWCWALQEWMTARSAAQSAEVEFGYVVR
jgi:hypothetical protein